MKTTAEMIEVMAAFDRGEEIECWMWGENKWRHCESPYFDWANCDYRIKPKPAKPKYTEADIPLCAIIRKKDLPQDVIDKACLALVRYANDNGHKAHQGVNCTLKSDKLFSVFTWSLSDEGHDFWEAIDKATERADPYAEAKKAWRDGVLQVKPINRDFEDYTFPREPNWSVWRPSELRRKPAPTGKWVECAVENMGGNYIYRAIPNGWPLCLATKSQSVQGYGGTKYEGREDFVFAPVIDERGVMLPPVAVRFWVENNQIDGSEGCRRMTC